MGVLPEGAISIVTVLTTDGLRVALAGLPATMPVVVESELGIQVSDVEGARGITEMPEQGINVCIPYRMMPDSVVQLRCGALVEAAGQSANDPANLKPYVPQSCGREPDSGLPSEIDGASDRSLTQN